MLLPQHLRLEAQKKRGQEKGSDRGVVGRGETALTEAPERANVGESWLEGAGLVRIHYDL